MNMISEQEFSLK